MELWIAGIVVMIFLLERGMILWRQKISRPITREK
jgi:hypothetical protein